MKHNDSMKREGKKSQCASERKARMDAITTLAERLKISLIKVVRPDGDVGYAFTLGEAAKMAGCCVAAIQAALSSKCPCDASVKGCKLSRTGGKAFRVKRPGTRHGKLVTMAKLAL